MGRLQISYLFKRQRSTVLGSARGDEYKAPKIRDSGQLTLGMAVSLVVVKLEITVHAYLIKPTGDPVLTISGELFILKKAAPR